ncbi:hypothetical protein I316_06606 [Kwoniella heveanensis BCC8398]|uniref:Uncharacterized protein n=1 Tax=Kwoniella heveanensis BCC8398 TaxID=1296120 RepID=A0A1B9GL50_9TREE|nr:hypothetical protein I316_06606 [Kwoniella heveanensis BCC8398]
MADNIALMSRTDRQGASWTTSSDASNLSGSLGAEGPTSSTQAQSSDHREPTKKTGSSAPSSEVESDLEHATEDDASQAQSINSSDRPGRPIMSRRSSSKEWLEFIDGELADVEAKEIAFRERHYRRRSTLESLKATVDGMQMQLAESERLLYGMEDYYNSLKSAFASDRAQSPTGTHAGTGTRTDTGVPPGLES